jgi:hypothetical protein
MSQPKLGDRRPLAPCDVCGGEQYEQYESWPSYHNDSEEGWRAHLHRQYLLSGKVRSEKCLHELSRRIAALEGKK